jgi:hypothetical protein
MSYPGEYVQVYPRVQDVRTAVISGYVACRLRIEDPVFTSGRTTYPAVVTLSNLSTTNTLGVAFKETNDRSVSGVRYLVAGDYAASLVPAGFKEVKITPRLPFLEVWGTDGPADMRMHIASKTRWEILAFDKDADSAFVYPPMWNVKPSPTAVSSP